MIYPRAILTHGGHPISGSVGQAQPMTNRTLYADIADLNGPVVTAMS